LGDQPELTGLIVDVNQEYYEEVDVEGVDLLWHVDKPKEVCPLRELLLVHAPIVHSTDPWDQVVLCFLQPIRVRHWANVLVHVTQDEHQSNTEEHRNRVAQDGHSLTLFPNTYGDQHEINNALKVHLDDSGDDGRSDNCVLNENFKAF
jgi:hypothetical protein